MNLPPRPASFITDAAVDKALHWLAQNAPKIGNAKAEAVLTQRMREHILALEMKKHGELSAAAQEREARASEAYKQAIIAEAKAAGVYEVMKAQREACAMKIEAWRTEQSNFRAMKI